MCEPAFSNEEIDAARLEVNVCLMQKENLTFWQLFSNTYVRLIGTH